jgi:hypothetical protein
MMWTLECLHGSILPFFRQHERYFEDFVAIIVVRTTSYAVLNIVRWVLKDNELGLYTYDNPMKVDVVKDYNISAVKL